MMGRLLRSCRPGFRLRLAKMLTLVVLAGIIQLPGLLFAADPSGSLSEAKPLGAWFGLYERLIFDDEFAWNNDVYAVSRYNGKTYSPFSVKDLPDYAAVFIGRGAGKPLTADEQSRLHNWVADGGHLILNAADGQRMFGIKPPEWLGITAWWWANKEIDCDLQMPRHPLATGLSNSVGKNEKWQTKAGVVIKPEGASVIGTEAGKSSISMLYVTECNRGRIIFIGDMLSPQGRPAYAEKKIINTLLPEAVTFWKNLTKYLAIPGRSEAIKNWAGRKSEPFVLWWRYQPEVPLGGKLQMPPYPRAGEEIKDIRLDMGTGERLRRTFFLTTLRNTELKITPMAFKGRGGTLPADCIKTFIQERPAPGYLKSSYWLVPLRDSFRLEANDTSTLWITADTTGAIPGDYRGGMLLSDGAGFRMEVPIILKVWDIRSPGSETLHFEMEHLISSMPGGFWIEKNRARQHKMTFGDQTLVETPMNSPEILNNYFESLCGMGVNFVQDYGKSISNYPFMYASLRESGKLLWDEAQSNVSLRQGGSLPGLDFSFLDPIYERAIAAGMNRFATNYLLSGDATLNLARRIYGDPALPAESEAHRRIRKWYWDELSAYLKEKGFVKIYAKIMDEFGPRDFPAFIASAEVMKKSDINVYTTTYNFDRDPGSVAALDPYIDLWQSAWRIRPRQAEGSRKSMPFGRGDEVWGLVSGSYWGKVMDYFRASGWTAAWLGYRGVHAHGFMRWYWGEVEGAFVGPNEPYLSVTAASTAQGVSEGRYLAQLYDMLDYARSSGKATVVAAAVRKELEESVVGTGENCLLRLKKEDDNSDWWPQVCTSPEVYDKAKVRVLELSLRLKQALGRAPVSWQYADIGLVDRDKPTAVVVGDAVAGKLLTDGLKELTGLAFSGLPGRGDISIVTGTLSDKPVSELAERELKGRITSWYPRVGGYAIEIIPGTSSRRAAIAIIGGDQAGTAKGIANFLKLLSAVNRW